MSAVGATLAEGTTAGSYYDVFLDPAVNYHVRKSIAYQPRAGLKGADTGGVVTVVKRFKDFGDGVYVPVEIERYGGVAGYGGPVDRIVVKDLVVNARLPADALDFTFPENCVVVDLRDVSSSDKRKVWVWGPDNRPLREYKGRQAEGELLIAENQGGHVRFWLAIAGIVILVCIVLVFRRLRRKARA